MVSVIGIFFFFFLFSRYMDTPDIFDDDSLVVVNELFVYWQKIIIFTKDDLIENFVPMNFYEIVIHLKRIIDLETVIFVHVIDLAAAEPW